MSSRNRLPSIDENNDNVDLYRARSTPSSILSHPSSAPSKKLRRSKSVGMNVSNLSPPILIRRVSYVGPTLLRATSLLQDIHMPQRRNIEDNMNNEMYDVEQAIDIIGFGRYQVYLFIITGLIFMSYAVELMAIPFLLPIFQKEFEITALESAMVPLSSIIGAFIGASVLSILSDKYGRKWIIIIGVLLTAISAVISAFATNIYFESAARFFVGFFSKISVVAITILAEFLPTKYRGKILMLSGIFWSLGLMFSVSLAWICLTYYDWRIYIKSTTIPLWFGAIFACFIDESPHYLITKAASYPRNDPNVTYYYDKCKKVLEKMSNMNHKSNVLPQNKKLMISITKNVSDIDENTNDKICNLSSFLLLLCYIAYQSGYYGILFVSVRYVAKLDSIYELHHDMYWEMILVAFAEIPGIILGVFIIDKGRKFTINLAFCLFTLTTYCLVFINIEFNRAFGILLLLLSRMFNALSGGALGVYFEEFYATKIRASALGIATSISMIFKMSSIVIAEALHIMLGMYIFGTLGIIGFMASLSLVIDSEESWSLLT